MEIKAAMLPEEADQWISQRLSPDFVQPPTPATPTIVHWPSVRQAMGAGGALGLFMEHG